MRRWIATMTLFLAVLWAVPAVAADADALNEEGLEAFSAGDFVAAAEKFAEAYASEPDPVFRKSEAVAWFKAERCDPAIKAANAFLLEWDEGGDAVGQAESVIANCKVELAEDAMEAASFELADRLLFEAEEHAQDQYTRDRISTTRVELASARRAAAGKDNEDDEKNDEVETADGPDQTTPNEDDAATASPRSSPIGPIGFFAGGAMLVTAAIWHAVTLLATVPRLEDAADGGDPDKHAKLGRAVDTARWAVPALYVAGATTMGVGAWFWFNDNSDSEKARGSEAGVSFFWRF